MHEYETYVIGSNGKVSLIAAATQFSDFAAIRAAQKLCRTGQSVEVWRDDICVYSERPKKPIAPVWPLQGKAAS
jgi:hypothetical protein